MPTGKPSLPPRPLAWRAPIGLLLATLTACSDDPPVKGAQDSSATAAETVDDTTVADSNATTTSDVALDCPGGTGCPCTENTDCDSTICTETSAGKVCAQTCIENCPAGFVCKAYAGGGGDATNICVPRHGRRCDPCTASKQCQVPGQESARCVLYGIEGIDGAFCGSSCASDSECGAGYKCVLSEDIEGGKTKQCARDGASGSAICPCGKLAADKQLSTPCKADQKRVDGPGTVKCPGVRRCTKAGADGLTACDAAPPKTETCDLLDNDCNGVTDDPSKVCNDDNVCTADSCDPKSSEANSEGCVHLTLSGKVCDDGEICTDGDKCLAGKCNPGTFTCECKDQADCDKKYTDKCKAPRICDLSDHTCKASGSDVSCDGGGPCKKSECQPATGKCQDVLTADGTQCKDGKACTIAAECKAGACAPTASCECEKTADCASLEDGNPCTGTLFCLKEGPPKAWKCTANPASVIKCPKEKDSACTKSQCHKISDKDGKCLLTPEKDGASCEDGTLCTASDKCLGGACVGGVSTCACTDDDDCAAKDDGDACNGITFCDAATSKCKVNPATIVACPSVDDSFCFASTCDKKTGKCAMAARNDKQACDDGNPCTKGEVCETGKCAATPLANTCSCTNDGECAGQEDGDACNGTLFCNKAAGKCEVAPKTVVQCPSVDDSLCRANTCDPKSGKCSLKPQNSGVSCDDGNACTKDDGCADGVCAGVGNCLCAKDADCAKGDDGNPCNGTLVCNKAAGTCVMSLQTAVKCDGSGDTACRKNVCNAKTGSCAMRSVNVGHGCDDGSKCTVGDFCKSTGKCEGAYDKQLCPCTKHSECDDGAGCSIDVCDPSKGCVHVGIDAGCDDGNPCTAGDCSPGIKGADEAGCVQLPLAASVGCDDGETCTATDVCDGNGGCSGKDVCGACKADADCAGAAKLDLCAGTKVCVAGSCKAKAGSKVSCPPTNQPCVGSRCDSKTGVCAVGPIASLEGKSCDDGSACTASTSCKSGKCVGKSACACKTNADCAAKEDGDACNGTLTCEVIGGVGACVVNPLTIVTCDPRKDLPCVKATCEPKTGQCAPAPAVDGAPCDDGNPCTGADGAGGKDGCKAGTCAGGANSCFCLGDGDCTSKDDGDPCTGVLACVGGKCATKAGSAVQCAPSSNPCEVAYCDTKDGKCRKSGANDGWACDDGEKCTTGDHCSAGVCKAVAKIAGCCSSAAFCDDGVACTKDSCDEGTKDAPGKGCVHAPMHAACDDGNACSVNTCAPLAAESIAGCRAVTATDGAACSDGDLCTGDKGADACSKGVCKAGAAKACAEGSACKAGVCEVFATDLDHDGLIGKSDPCPTVWNPDGDAEACPTWDTKGAHAAWTASLGLALTEPGQAAGLSKVRRTNEPVEVALVNGIADASMIAHWPLDGDGTDLVSGNKLTLTPSTFSAAASTTLGKAASWPTGGYGKGAASKTSLVEMTAMLWVQPGAKAHLKARALWTRSVNGNQRLAQTWSESGGKALLTSQVCGPRANSVTIDAPWAIGSWHHVAMVMQNAERLTVYVDGKLVAHKATGAPGDPSKCSFLDAMNLGAADNGDNKWIGGLDDAVLFNRALSPAEIAVYARSQATYGATMVPGAQEDYDDLRVMEATDAQAGAHATHFELIGARRHSDTSIDGVAAYYPMDANAHATIGKDMIPTGSKAVLGRFGDKGGALYIGKDAAISSGTFFKDHGGLTDDTLAVEAWVWWDEGSSDLGRIVTNHYDGVTYGLELTAVRKGSKLEARVQTDNGSAKATAPFKAGRWSHVAMSYDGKALKLFVDGIEQDSKALTGKVKLGTWKAMVVGAGQNKGHDNLLGAIDELLFHSVARTADYFAKRARGLPRVRLLAHTREKAEKSGFWRSHDYALLFGNKAAKAVATKVVALDTQTVCDGLLSPCLGYFAWYRFEDALGLAFDSSTARQHAFRGDKPTHSARVASPFGLAYRDPDAKGGFVGPVASPQIRTVETVGGTRSTNYRHVSLGAGHWVKDAGIGGKGSESLVAGNNLFGASILVKHTPSGLLHAVLSGEEKPGTIALWLDGTKVGSKQATEGPKKHGKVYIGASSDGAVSAHAGPIDEVRLMTRPLPPDEHVHAPLFAHAQKWTAPKTTTKPSGCDDGNACTVDIEVPGGGCLTKTTTSKACDLAGKLGVCTAGTCKATGTCALGTLKLNTVDGTDAAGSIARNDAGQLLLAGWTTRLKASGGGGREAWLALIGADRKFATELAVGGPTDEVLSGVAATSGGWIVGGRQRNSKNQDERWAVWVDASLKVQAQKSWGLGNVRRVVADGHGARLFSDQVDGSVVKTEVRSAPGAGVDGWKQILTHTAPAKTFHAEAMTGGGALSLVQVGEVSKRNIEVVTIDGGGGVQSRAIAPFLSGSELNNAARRTDGKFYIAGDSDNTKGLIALIDSKSKVLWTKIFDQKAAAYFSSVASTPSGVVAFGASKAGGIGNYDSWLIALDAAGNKRWERFEGGTLPDYGNGIVAAPIGVVTLLRTSESKSVRVQYRDAWGALDCDKVGLCAFAAGGCDDDDPCTTDACDKAKGCVHSAVQGCEKPENSDLDHDGVAGKDDGCPTAWSPDDDVARGESSCAVWDSAGAHQKWTSSAPLGLHEPGLETAWSSARRTNEPVEIPLVNGISDSSLLKGLPLDVDAKGIDGGQKGAKAFAGTGMDAVGLSLDGRSRFTVMAWCKASKLHGGHAVMMKKGNVEYALILFGGTSKIGAQLMTDGGQLTFNEAGGVYTVGQWVHVAVTFADKAFSVWVDGVYLGEKTAPGTVAKHDGVLRIGEHFHGVIDDVVLFDRALTGREIGAYVQSRRPFGTSLVAGAQADLDDVRVTEKTDAQPWEHGTHFEVVGARPHSDSELDGIVAYWKLDGDGMDVVGKNHGTATGTKPTLGRFGDAGGALWFDGKAASITVTSLAKQSWKAGSWEVWFNVAACGQRMSIVNKNKPGTADDLAWLITEKCELIIQRQTAQHDKELLVGVIDANRWYHAGISWDGANVIGYLDGEAKLQLPDGSPVSGGDHPLVIGDSGNAQFKRPFHGAIDEVIVHNVARSADYFAKRAIGLPRVRFLAHTRSRPSTSGGYRFHDYTVRWGNKAAKSPKTRLISADKKTACDALLSPCLGYAGWWRFDHPATPLLDSSSARNTGTMTGGKAVGGAHLQGWEFSGGSGAVPSAPTLDTPRFTIEASAYLTAAAPYATLLSKDLAGDGKDNDAFNFGLHEKSDLKLSYNWAGSKDAVELTTKTPIAIGRWTHLAVSTDGKALVAHEDGAVVKTSVAPGVANTSPHPITFGGALHQKNGLTAKWPGHVDEIRLMSRALSTDELLHYPRATN